MEEAMVKKPEDQFDMSDFNMGDGSFVDENVYEDQQQFNSAPIVSENEVSSRVSAHANPEKKIVNLTSDIPIQIVAVLGKKTSTVKDIVSMKMGQVLELGKMPNEAIDLVANGKLIAKGELVEIDGRLGVRILKIFD